MNLASYFTVAVCGTDFGWGSAGKISSILDALEEQMGGVLQVVMLGSTLGRPVLAGRTVKAWYEPWPRHPEALRALLDDCGVSAGLVVLDPEAADALERAGCPTVYVDSLPYLWTQEDPLPTSVTYYCAQLCFALPRHCWPALRRIERLVWVEGITNEPRGHHVRDVRYAVVNLGGLHSPTIGEGHNVYPQLVLGPTVSALAEAGYHLIEVCGNLDNASVPTEVGTSTEISVGRRPHHEFLRLLDGADVLVTSPGLTTLLEAGTRGLPTVCLPPQNVSQVLNGDQFAALVDPRCRITWPEEILDLAELEQVRVAGEEAGLELVYEALASAAGSANLPDYLRVELGYSLKRLPAVSNWNGMCAVWGTRGAQQVASILHDLLTNPRSNTRSS